MPSYIVTVTKWGSMLIDADDRDKATQIAADLESEGAFEMSIEVDVEEAP